MAIANAAFILTAVNDNNRVNIYARAHTPSKIQEPPLKKPGLTGLYKKSWR